MGGLYRQKGDKTMTPVQAHFKKINETKKILNEYPIGYQRRKQLTKYLHRLYKELQEYKKLGGKM